MNTNEPKNDPSKIGAQPPFKEQEEIQYPGLTREMTPVPDHGEQTYEGHGLLAGKAAVITGADSGIGRAVAIAFAREGADVVISYLDEDEDAQETARQVEKAGRKAIVIGGDIRDEDFCKNIIERCVSELGRIDILVNNAAFQSSRDTTQEIPTEDFDRAFKTNVYATFFLSRAALGHMKEGSSIINTTSIQGFDPSGHLLHYAATKGAIANMTKTMAETAIKQGIRVNAVAPGPVWTPLIPATMPKKMVESFGTQSLFGRPAQPGEMAPLYVFLASKLASYVTGEVYGATGGTMPL